MQTLAFISTVLSSCSQTEKTRQCPFHGDRNGFKRALSQLSPPVFAMALRGPPLHQELNVHQRHTFGSQSSNLPSLCYSLNCSIKGIENQTVAFNWWLQCDRWNIHLAVLQSVQLPFDFSLSSHREILISIFI